MSRNDMSPEARARMLQGTYNSHKVPHDWDGHTGAHARWHTDLGVFNPKCELCRKEKRCATG